MTIRVLLADDHPAVRAGIRNALEKAPDIDVVAEAGDGAEALSLAQELQPDVVVLDCHLPRLSGPDVARQLAKLGLPARVLALSAHADDQYVYGMLHAGAAGYVLKDEALETVVEAVREVAGGREWYSQPVAGKMAAWMRGETPSQSAEAGLTEREIEVLILLARGWPNEGIADELVVSEGTVKNHVTSIYSKLGVHSRAEAVAWAWRNDLVMKG